MLTSNRNASQASADPKRATRKRVPRAVAGTEVINEPKPDWVHPEIAPFYCFRNGTYGEYLRHSAAWADAVCAELQRRIERPPGHHELDDPGFAKLLSAPQPKWSFNCVERAWPFRWMLDSATEAPPIRVSAIAMGVATDIQPGRIVVWPNGELLWAISGDSDQILKDPRWDKISQHEQVAVRWHRWLLKGLFRTWRAGFERAVISGAVQIMARKNSALAPFERINLNQWQYFKVDDEPMSPGRLRTPLRSSQLRWGDPHGFPPGWTATGPAGEKLYSIHIAPGVPTAGDRNREPEPEEKCLHWLLELIEEYPDRPPARRDRLAEEAVEKFSGLTRNGFLRCFCRAQVLAQNQNWSHPGRPPNKSP
jgi:hypothetical protein